LKYQFYLCRKLPYFVGWTCWCWWYCSQATAWSSKDQQPEAPIPWWRKERRSPGEAWFWSWKWRWRQWNSLSRQSANFCGQFTVWYVREWSERAFSRFVSV